MQINITGEGAFIAGVFFCAACVISGVVAHDLMTKYVEIETSRVAYNAAALSYNCLTGDFVPPRD